MVDSPTQSQTVESGDAVPPALLEAVGCTVTRIVIDDSITLSFRGHGRCGTLRIDGSGVITSSADNHQYDPDADPSSCGPFAQLVYQQIRKVTLDPSGMLDLNIGDTVVRVMPEDHAISWSAALDTGARATCIAEGQVVWE